MEKHKILYTTSFNYMFGGGQWSLYYMVKNLNKELFHPVVLCPGEGELAEKMRAAGADIVFLGLGRMRHLNLLVLKKLISILKKERITLIHTDSTTETFYAGLAARILKIPLVWHIRSSTGGRLLDRILLLMSTKIIYVAKALQSRFDWMKDRRKAVTIYNGIDLEEFDASPPCYSVRSQFGIDDAAILLACVGRIEEGKGQKYLIRAMRQIEGARLIFIGKGEHAYLQRLSELCENIGVSDKIIFAGYREDIPSIMKAVDIVVLPSLGEAFSRVIVEAMAAQKPVVATDVGGNREAIADGVSGYIVPVGDVVALTDRINELVCDSKKRDTMGLVGRERVERKFEIKKDMKATEKLYRKLINERERG